ncbi:MAG: phosphatase [Bacteroidetes bacterium]|nr:MAG: phosphatase [Bacteroidota bacterium]
MNLAVIDIGSNAIRLQINRLAYFKGEAITKKLEFIRFPLRLGQDSFSLSRILPNTEDKFVMLMEAFSLIMKLYEVKDYMICATAAMREANNGKEIVQRVYERCGLRIEIIDGDREAEVINYAIAPYIDDNNYVHIDVGGGSTELSLYVSRKKIASKSFKIGSVRLLEGTARTDIWDKIEAWINKKIEGVKGEFFAVGTGGNINKIYSMKVDNPQKMITRKEVEGIRAMISEYSLEERQAVLQLKEDRAEVILPASEIYVKILQIIGINTMFVPDVGLKDGMMECLYLRQLPYDAH